MGGLTKLDEEAAVKLELSKPTFGSLTRMGAAMFCKVEGRRTCLTARKLGSFWDYSNLFFKSKL